MLRHLEKLCAFWLVAQILLPFTAPFPICDLSDLLNGAHRHSTAQNHNAPVAPQPRSSRFDGDFAFAPPLATTAGYLKLVVVSSQDVSTIVSLMPLPSEAAPVVADVGRRSPPPLQQIVLRL
jgi:hypothetical protein